MGELIRISEPVATELEITEWADREMKKPGGGKALLFEKPTVGGRISPFPVAINTMGSDRRMALSMGAESVESVGTPPQSCALQTIPACHQCQKIKYIFDNSLKQIIFNPRFPYSHSETGYLFINLIRPYIV